MKIAVPLLIALTLSACSTTSPDVVKRDDANRMSTVLDGKVLSVRSVKVEGSQSGIGGAAGGAVGAIAGSSAGGRREGQVGAILGAVAGAVVGNAMERVGTQEDALEILVQLKSGERRAIVQARGGEELRPGDAVILVTTSAKVRVTRAPN